MSFQSSIETHTVEIAGESLVLHPGKGVYWEAQHLLLLGDLHFGKAAHFRKNGIPVSGKVGLTNMERLADLIHYFEPGGVLFLGDLFHSEYNPAWDRFGQLVDRYPNVRFELVMGNHDILSAEQYDRFGLNVYPEPLHYPPFYFSHHPMERIPEDGYNLAGHIHPGVWLKGEGKQKLKFPCFLFGPNQGLLPAFGAFTGLGLIQPKRQDRVFIITSEAVLPV